MVHYHLLLMEEALLMITLNIYVVLLIVGILKLVIIIMVGQMNFIFQLQKKLRKSYLIKWKKQDIDGMLIL